MRHSLLSFVAIGLFSSAVGCAASGSTDAAHGPVFGPNEGGTDGGSTPPTDSGTPEPDGAVAPPVDGSVIDAPADALVDAPLDVADAGGCTDKTAVLAGTASTLYEAISTGAGAWTTSSVPGTYLGTPTLVALGGGFTGVTVGPNAALQWTTTTGGAWSALAGVSGALANGMPALAALGASVHLVYLGTNGKYYHGTFSAGAWDAANDPVGGAATQSFGPTGVGMAAVGGALLFAHRGGTTAQLYAEGLAAGSGVPVATAQVESITPATIAMSGGASDAMVVYVHAGDVKISYATRAGATWTDHGAIDTTLFTNDPVAAAPIAGGKAVLVFRGSDGKSYGSIFNGTTWSLPAAPLAAGTLGGPPSIAAGACGDDAVAALPMTTGEVQIVRLVGGAWAAATSVTGTGPATRAAIATGK